MKISIVLPAKNEVGAISQTIAQIQQLQLAHEIIVVNDGSTDQTKQVAETAGAKVVSHPYSKGNGAAIKTGARTATGDKGNGGRGILTFTPENGRTELVVQFMDNPATGQIMLNAGWDDAPHLSESVKQTLLESYPAHQRDMRTKGIPMLGHGRIYDLSEEFITCDPFEIPDHFMLIDGMDFGWDHPQAQIQLAIDTENDMFCRTPHGCVD